MSSAVGYSASTVIGYPIEYYLRRQQPNPQPPRRVHPQPNRTQTTASAAAISRAPQSDVSRSSNIDDGDDDDQEHASDGPCIILVVLNIILVLFLAVVGFLFFVNLGRRRSDDGGAADSFINIPKFEVEFFSMSNSINVSESSPLSWNIGFNITNLNEGVTFSYDDVSVYVVYHKVTLSGATLEPFNLGSKISISLRSTVVGSAQNLEWALSAIEREVIAKGDVSFDVGFRSSVEFGPSDFMEYFSSLEVYCEGLSVEFSSNATAGGGGMVTGSKNCKSSLSGS